MNESVDMRRKRRARSEVSRDLGMASRFAPRVNRGDPVAPQGRPRSRSVPGAPTSRLRSRCMIGVVVSCFAVLSVQLVLLALSGQNVTRSSMSHPLANAFARPDIVDRKGRLLATDVALPSLYVDPTLVISRDEVVETLKAILPDLDERRLWKGLRDKRKRFMWIRRGLSPAVAQKVFDAGLPGLSFRSELTRAYPMGRLGGHLVGAVDVDNKGIAGIERYLDERKLVEPVYGVSSASGLPVRLSLDIGAQHAVEEELASAIKRYKAVAASGVVLDVESGEIVAAASLPGVDPMQPKQWQDEGLRDRLSRGAYELGSVFKLMSVAMALDNGVVSPRTMIDVTKPIEADGHTIRDPHGSGRPLSVREIFVRSSNVGAGMLALKTGAKKQKAFLARLGLLSKMKTEAGPVEPPRGPAKWGRVETVTVSYGHGIALAPLQFAAASAALVNGGVRVMPSFLRGGAYQAGEDGAPERGERVIATKTSAQVRQMMRSNVSSSHGTGRRADVPGYRVGGKTGTAELPARGGYKETSVISSFVAAFPMDKPKYVVLISIFEPKPTKASDFKIVAALNAAPVAGRVISRIGPLLGVKAVFE